MFEIATGSGKTLVMAGLILECYKQGYQNFIFFVNSASILEKTKLNFTDSVSSKYLFSETIHINDENTEIKSINNLNESHDNAINIYFSTIQGLFSLFTKAKENAITLEDLKDQKLVFLADEAHHLNTETKKKLNDSEEKRNWESVVKLALEQNKDNLLLEFSATIPKEKSVEEKYKNLKVITYTLKEFSEDKFCKNIYSLSYENKALETRFLGACVSSLYKELLAQHHNIENFKPCILFKSERIEDSKENQERFNAFLENLSPLDLENFFNDSRNAFFKDVKNFFDKQKYTPNLTALLQTKFKKSTQINTNNEKELEKGMLLLNSLEDRDNPKRVVFSVDKLNEGWDVLNLFDIVRLKNKASQKDTTKEAQLIGRGARYYPFSYNDFKPNRIEFYQRKFDFSNPLSALERLDYHAVYDSEFIAQLKNDLKEIGLGFVNEKEKQTIPLTPTKHFKCYYASNTKDKNKNLFNKDYTDHVKVKLQSLHVPLFGFIVHEKKVDFKEDNKSDKTFYLPHALDKIPLNYFLKALNLKNLDFKTLKKAFKKYSFNNKVEFIREYISPLKTNFHKNQKFDDNKTLLKLAVYIIENLKDTLLKEQDKYSVSALELKEFETHNRILSASELEKDIPLYEWLLFKDMRKLDSDLERDFLDFINKNKEVLDKKFKEWCVLRNDRFTELKVFCNIESSDYYGQGFEPDFILFARTHSDEFLGFTCYMEAKGEHLEHSNAWKEEFLKMLENAELKSHNKKLDLKGLPFFTLHNSEFATAFDQIFKD
ncbi:DEAD/DEAH box helicase family protein [Helicobacter pylori]